MNNNDELSLEGIIDYKIKVKWNSNNLYSSFDSLSDNNILRKKYRILAEPSRSSYIVNKQNKQLVPPFLLTKYDTFFLFEEKAIEISEDYKEFLLYYNTNHINDIKYKVYLNLRKQDLYIRPGFKFGSDFIVYSADPNFIHADYMVSCFKKDEEINVLTVIANERIGVSTKKKLVYAFVNEDEVDYVKFTWINM